MSIGVGIAISPSFEGSHIPGVSALFSYPKNSYNQGEADPTPTITGTTGGTFTGTSGIVFVDSGGSADSSTGQIDLSASSIATHTITYTVSGVSSNFELGITAIPYQSTRSFSFDGINDYFDAGVISSLVSTTNFSVSGWFYFNSTATNKAIFSYGGATNTQYSFALQTQLNKLRFYFAYFLNDGGNRFVDSSIALSTSTWYHIAVTYDGNETGNTNRAKIYVDGVNVTTTGGGTINSTTTASTGSFNIGRWDISTGRFLDGKADEVSIWNTTLSSDAVTEIYNSGAPNDLESLTNASSSNLVAWYKMGE